MPGLFRKRYSLFYATPVLTASAYKKAYTVEELPNVSFNDTLTLYDSNETIELIHFPNAHNDGDAVIYFKSANIYQTGDIFENYGLPYFDKNAGSDIYGTI